MKEYLKEIVLKASNRLLARSMVAEYCQARILQALQEIGVFRSWVFHGGTALRFLYLLPRYSEYLDFALEGKVNSGEFIDTAEKVQRRFEAEAYEVQLKIKDDKTIKSVFIRFPGLLNELGLSPHSSEVLAVKIELDTNPPEGAGVANTVIRRYLLLNLFHHDKPSLLAGKLHAVLTRSYVKGRDLYDLMWYLSDPAWPEPNLLYLKNALGQTNWTGPGITGKNWSKVTVERIETMDWNKVVEDVCPSIEQESDIAILTKENVLDLLKSRADRFR